MRRLRRTSTPSAAASRLLCRRDRGCTKAKASLKNAVSYKFVHALHDGRQECWNRQTRCPQGFCRIRFLTLFVLINISPPFL